MEQLQVDELKTQITSTKFKKITVYYFKKSHGSRINLERLNGSSTSSKPSALHCEIFEKSLQIASV